MEYKSETRQCQNCKKDFTIEPEDFNFYEKIKVPPPTFCSNCRLQRRLAWINERSLYFANCDLCSKRMMSMYHPSSPHKVYCSTCYFSDKWNASTYGTPIDFSKTFFKQLYELYMEVPKVHLEYSLNNKEQSEYANHIFSYSRNQYLSYSMVRSEDCMYSKMGANGNKECVDCFDFSESERCYELVFSSGNYESTYLTESHSCVHSMFLYDCSNCTNCFMSSHLRNKSYVFRNEQLNRETYFEKMSEIETGKTSIFEDLKKEYIQMTTKTFRRFATIVNSPNSTGNFIFNSKNIRNSFSVTDSEDDKYTIFCAGGAFGTYDITYSGKNEQAYEITVCGARNYNLLFSHRIGKYTNATYSIAGKGGASDVFGCVGFNEKKQYCILNKQYTKEEYEKLVPKIIEHMIANPYIDKKGRIYKYGEFFPAELSPFAYNESLAFEEFPMSKEEVSKEGYLWRDLEEKNYTATLDSEKLLNNINGVGDEILRETIACPNKGQANSKCTFAYRIVSDELSFYRRMHLPLPRYCPNCRYYERRKRSNPWKLWHRQCMCDKEKHTHSGCCENEFETSYSPERTDIVYCEQCYKAEVY